MQKCSKEVGGYKQVSYRVWIEFVRPSHVFFQKKKVSLLK